MTEYYSLVELKNVRKDDNIKKDISMVDIRQFR